MTATGTNSFLPADYVMPTSQGKNYFKPTDKKTKLRIMGSPIMGYVDRDKSGEKPRPIRTQKKQQALGEQEPKHFRAMVVWNYELKSLQIREVTQASVREQLKALIDGERGDPTQYDIVVHKEGQSLDTKYFVATTPQGIVKADQDIIDKYNNTDITLEALYDGGDPFAEKEATFTDGTNLPF